MASKTQKASTRTLNPAEDTYTISEEYYKVDQGTLGGFRPDKETRIFAFFAAADFSILAKKRAVASQRCPFLVFRLYSSRPQACRHASVPDTVPDAAQPKLCKQPCDPSSGSPAYSRLQAPQNKKSGSRGA